VAIGAPGRFKTVPGFFVSMKFFTAMSMEESSMNLDARPLRDPFANDRLTTLQRAKQEPM
jgi:hypothetical protein